MHPTRRIHMPKRCLQCVIRCIVTSRRRACAYARVHTVHAYMYMLHVVCDPLCCTVSSGARDAISDATSGIATSIDIAATATGVEHAQLSAASLR